MSFRFKTIFKWVFIFALFAAAGFWILGALGGDSDRHREVVEGYLQDITGLEARIGQINSLNFFPTIIIDFENLDMVDVALPIEEQRVEIHADDAFFAVDFRDVIFGSGKFRSIEVNHVQILAGHLMEEAVVVDFLRVEHVDEGVAFLMGSGMIGERAFTMKVPVLVYGSLPKAKYRFDLEYPVVLTMEDGARFELDYVDHKVVLKPES